MDFPFNKAKKRSRLVSFSKSIGFSRENCATSQLMIFVLFFLVAVAYSSAGFGGGSSYLALLTLWSIPYEELRIMALVCNIAVVACNIWMHKRMSKLDLKSAIPFVVLSIPAAVIMSTIKLQNDVYFLILGPTLVVAGILLLFKPISSNPKKPSFSWSSVWVGGFIGGLSGLVGIGGGIFLSPYLHFSKWGSALRIAALSSFFIFINSISGLIGHVSSHGWSVTGFKILGLVSVVILGSILGNFLAYKKLNNSGVKRLTGVLVLVLGARLLFKFL